VRIDYQPWGASLAELADAARRAEAAGARVVWAPELHRDATVTAAALAAATAPAAGGLGRVGVGTGIALAFARSPLLTALAALDLDELSGGRFRLGLGSGVRRLVQDWHAAPFDPPVARLRDTVAAVRAVLAGAHTGAPLCHAGDTVAVSVTGWRRPHPPVRERLPVYLAGVGPAMTALAGEVGDGWLGHELCPPGYLATAVTPALAKGLARAGRDRSELDVVAAACCAVHPDPRAARRLAAGVVGFYASVASYADLFAAAGFAAEQAAVVAARRGGRAADDLADVVGDELVAAFTLAGTPDEVAAGLRRYAGLADAVKLSPPTHGLPPAEIRAAQDRILALVRELA
jgi:probable F420-dependent oxidoreductase